MAKFKLLARWIAFDGARPGDIVETDDPERIKHGLNIGFFEPMDIKLGDMNMAALKVVADDEAVDVTGLKSKKQVVAAIKDARKAPVASEDTNEDKANEAV